MSHFQLTNDVRLALAETLLKSMGQEDFRFRTGLPVNI
jgi:hypothetical protein